jgi:sec-independent protein translocase protein TatC
MALVPFPKSPSGALQLPPEEDDESASGKMSFLEHLEELRKRILYACYGVLFGVAVSVYWITDIVRFVLAPAIGVLPQGSSLIMSQPGEGFSLHVTVALIVGAIVGSPIIMYQVWKFIAPGLYSNEKRFAIPFVLLSSIGAVAGAAFNHFIAFPSIMSFFALFDQPGIRYLPTVSLVFGLYLKMLIGLALIFQMPTLAFFLARMRMITARWLIAKFRIAFLLSVIVAALVTPTSDPLNLAIFTAPMIGLYLLSIGVVWISTPRKAADELTD